MRKRTKKKKFIDKKTGQQKEKTNDFGDDGAMLAVQMGAECFVDRLLFTKNVRVNVCVVFKNYVLQK